MKRILIIALFLTISYSMNAQISVIANKSVGQSSVTASVLTNIYSLTLTKWTDGTKIVVLDNSSDAKTVFYSLLGKDQLTLKKEWLKKQLTGEAKAPESLGSDADVVTKVASTAGAVGFVKSSNVNGTVKVLAEFK